MAKRFSNGLTLAQDERFNILVEEMGEVLQVIGKIGRHGLDSFNPNDPESPTNRQLLETELGHVILSIDRLVEAEDVNGGFVAKSAQEKAKNGRKWLHHQPAAKKVAGIPRVRRG